MKQGLQTVVASMVILGDFDDGMVAEKDDDINAVEAYR